MLKPQDFMLSVIDHSTWKKFPMFFNLGRVSLDGCQESDIRFTCRMFCIIYISTRSVFMLIQQFEFLFLYMTCPFRQKDKIKQATKKIK